MKPKRSFPRHMCVFVGFMWRANFMNVKNEGKKRNYFGNSLSCDAFWVTRITNFKPWQPAASIYDSIFVNQRRTLMATQKPNNEIQFLNSSWDGKLTWESLPRSGRGHREIFIASLEIHICGKHERDISFYFLFQFPHSNITWPRKGRLE